MWFFIGVLTGIVSTLLVQFAWRSGYLDKLFHPIK